MRQTLDGLLGGTTIKKAKAKNAPASITINGSVVIGNGNLIGCTQPKGCPKRKKTEE